MVQHERRVPCCLLHLHYSAHAGKPRGIGRNLFSQLQTIKGYLTKHRMRHFGVSACQLELHHALPGQLVQEVSTSPLGHCRHTARWKCGWSSTSQQNCLKLQCMLKANLKGTQATAPHQCGHRFCLQNI